MKIDLSQVFNGSTQKIDIDAAFDMSSLDYCSYNPLKEPVKVNGAIYSKADVIYIELTIDFVFEGVCDRCADDFKKDYSLSVNRVIVEELQNENDDDDYIVVENRELDLEELTREEILLSLPSKVLCKDDCKGLCPQCGANLNVNKCDCKKEVDPRMEALLQLLDEE